MDITIWDIDPNRIAEINRNLLTALRDRGMRAGIIIMSEPPLISRMNLTHRVPLLEIEGQYWSLIPGESISSRDCGRLLDMICRKP